MFFVSLTLSLFFLPSLFFPCCVFRCISFLIILVTSYYINRALLVLYFRRGGMARKRQTDRAEPELTAHGFTRLAQL